MLGGHLRGARLIDVDHGDQRRIGGVAEDARVMAPERSDSDDSDPYRVSHALALPEDVPPR